MKHASFNHCYRLVWRALCSSWVAVPETGKAGRGRGSGGGRLQAALGLAACCLAPVWGWAAPSGGEVTSGAAVITHSDALTTIDQSSHKATINWQGFSVGASETVQFNQPSASSLTLNRVIGNERSVIDGVMKANGQVFLINSNGILFGAGSSVNVGGLVASTRDLSDADFNAGNYVFAGSSSGGVLNQGALSAQEGGYISLLGSSVSNQGVISATKGTVALAAGDKITLNFSGDALLSVTLDQGTLDALVENQQAIEADGGQVLLLAQAAEDLVGAQVNNGGLIQARTIDDLKGSITLYAYGGSTQVDGTLDASAPSGGDGGFIETSGAVVQVGDSAHITTWSETGRSGSWLIDPTDFTIASSGGDISGATLSSQLTNGNVSIASTDGASGELGDLLVNDAISWDAPTTLTLTAEHDIQVNQTISASYSGYTSSSPETKAGLTLNAGNDIHINNAITLSNAALALNYGGDYLIRTLASYSGAESDEDGMPVARTDTSGGVYGSVSYSGGVGSGDALTINGEDYTLIYSMAQWDALDNAEGYTYEDDYVVEGNYAIAHDLDAADTVYSLAPVYYFSGTLAGLGNVISNFTADNPQSYFGLIGNGGDYGSITVRDLGMADISFANISTNRIGAIVGQGNGVLSNVYSTGEMSGASISRGEG